MRVYAQTRTDQGSIPPDGQTDGPTDRPMTTGNGRAICKITIEKGGRKKQAGMNGTLKKVINFVGKAARRLSAPLLLSPQLLNFEFSFLEKIDFGRNLLLKQNIHKAECAGSFCVCDKSDAYRHTARQAQHSFSSVKLSTVCMPIFRGGN